MFTYEDYMSAAAYIKSQVESIPKTALVLGSGLGLMTDRLTSAVKLPYASIPRFPQSKNPSHEGCLYCGSLAGKSLFVFSGRTHCYEGYSMAEVSFYVTVLGLLGVKNLILTNAAGGINKAYNVGDIMMITDHIKLCSESPAVGVADPRLGLQFFDMSDAYAARLQKIALESAKKHSIALREGVYLYCMGPQYETPAEICAFRCMGADAVGMSTVPEVIAAAKAGISVLGFSLITNMAAGVTHKKLDDREVVETANKNGRILAELIEEITARLA